MSRTALVLCLATVAAACDRRATPAVSRMPAPVTDPFAPMPPEIAEALATGDAGSCAALPALTQVFNTQVDAGAVRAAAIALHRRGDLLRDCRELDVGACADPVDCYHRAYSLYLLHRDDRLAGLAADSLGRVEGSPARATSWFSEAVRLHRAAGSSAELVGSLNALGGALTLIDQPDAAVPLLRESLTLSVGDDTVDAQRLAHTALASAYLKLAADPREGETFRGLARTSSRLYAGSSPRVGNVAMVVMACRARNSTNAERCSVTELRTSFATSP